MMLFVVKNKNEYQLCYAGYAKWEYGYMNCKVEHVRVL